MGKLSIVATGMVFLLAVGGCAQPTIELDDIAIAEIGLKKLALVIDLKVHNPNPIAIRFGGVNYSMKAGGKQLVEGLFDQGTTTLRAGSTSNIRVPIVLDYESLSEVWQGVRAKETIPFELGVDIPFKVFGASIPVSLKHSGEIPPIYAPSIRVVDLDVVGVNNVKLALEVTNPNSFALPLTEIQGGLKYDGEKLFQIDSPSDATIPPGESRTVTIPIKFNAEGIGDSMFKLLTTSTKRKLEFDGNVKLATPKMVHQMLLGEKTQ